MNPIQKRLHCLGPHGFHDMAYVRWDQGTGGRATVCVHGLTRNGRDFDLLAQDLSNRGPVVAPDIVGRGRSSWLAVGADYGYPLYLSDVASLIASLDVDEVDFVGTSMGGLIGMLLAAQPGSPIRRLVLNDVGPSVPKAALERIGSYVGLDPKFPDLAALERMFRLVYGAFGNLTDAQWAALVEHGHRVLPDGQIGLNYDPAIALPFKGVLEDVDLWPVYDAVKCPTLIIRGGISDLLLAETAQAMTERGPKASLYTVPGVGHAPALMDPAQIAVIREFLA